MLSPDRIQNPMPLAAAAADYDVVRRAIGHIRGHWREQPEVEAIAEAAGVTPTELHHLFRRWAGLTPKDFLQALTIDHARTLLRESASVLDAAYEVGLSGMVEAAGYRIGAVADLRDVDAAMRQRVLRDNKPDDVSARWEDTRKLIEEDPSPNPMQLFWGETLRQGAPFLKVELFRDNPLGANLGAVLRQLKADKWFDTALILAHVERIGGAHGSHRALMDSILAKPLGPSVATS